MNRDHNPIILSRDVEGLLIPTAVPITIPAATAVYITQQLGATVTVNVNGNLVRIETKDLDALGITPKPEIHTQVDKIVDGPVDIELVWQQLHTCYDPEIPVDIVELGLIYQCHTEIINQGSGNRVNVDMTLTAPGCGMGPVLADEVKAKLLAIPNVTEVHVNLVFDPPWGMDKMSEAAKLTLGLL